MGTAGAISVTRVGTQVVVRLEGHISQADADRLEAALTDVVRMALHRVAVDLSFAQSLDPCAIDFLASLRGRWVVKHLNTPPHLRPLLREFDLHRARR